MIAVWHALADEFRPLLIAENHAAPIPAARESERPCTAMNSEVVSHCNENLRNVEGNC